MCRMDFHTMNIAFARIAPGFFLYVINGARPDFDIKDRKQVNRNGMFSKIFM